MNRDRSITLILGSVGLVTVICGLVLGGNPVTARRGQRDEERSLRLSRASSILNGAYSNTGALPGNTEAYLNLLQTAGFATPEAPVSDIPDYRQLGDETYELCITFEEQSHMGGVRFSQPTIQTEETPDFWSHDAGRTCYTARIPSWVKMDAAAKKAANTSSTSPVPEHSTNP